MIDDEEEKKIPTQKKNSWKLWLKSELIIDEMQTS